MKHAIHFTAFTLSLLMVASNMFGYRYTFTNHTNKPMLVGIKLCCLFEKMMAKVVEPHSMVTFVHGEDFPRIKFGYCLQSISFAKRVSEENRANPQSAAWSEITTTWIKPEIYDEILDFAESVGSGVEKSGKFIAKMAMAVGSGGATEAVSIPAAAAAEAAQKGIQKRVQDAMGKQIALASDDGRQGIEKRVRYDRGRQGQPVGNQLTQPVPAAVEKKESSFSLGGIGRTLVKLISTSLCRDRHWDIYEDSRGKVVFVSKIQQ